MKIIFIIVILTVSKVSNTQNIYSALEHDRDIKVRNKTPAEIYETNIFYNKSGKEVKKNKIVLNDKKKYLFEERRTEEGKLEARLTFSYDSTGQHSLNRKFEKWTSFGYLSETAFYQYDKNWFLIKVTDKNNKGEIIQETILTNNEKGNPVKLNLDRSGNSYGEETASYDYEANLAYTQILNSQGNILSRDTLTINNNLKTNDGSAYNELGDKLKSKNYVYDYEYDEFGNWITMNIFKIINDKQKHDRVYKRKFKYVN